MPCYLNIGNTHTQILSVRPDGERSLRTVPTDGFDPAALPWAPGDVAAASVVAEQTERLARAGIRMCTPEAAAGRLDFSAVDPSTLGQDRIANAVCVAANALLPAVALDFGTCITAEVVDDGRRFLGGAIFPGRLLARKALRLYTSKLPEIPLSPEPPPCPGANTGDAIRAGTDAAAIDAVAGFLTRLRAVLGRTPSVIACGGDRAFFLRAPELSGMKDGGDDFTLRGLEILFP